MRNTSLPFLACNHVGKELTSAMLSCSLAEACKIRPVLYRLAREVQAKQEEQERSLRGNAPKLQGLIQETRHIKTYVEQAISALYSGRQLHIIGEINNVI